MNKRLAAFAVGAHPDDIEFNMAGTLSLLTQAGFEPHMMNVSRSNLDSNVLPEAEITAIRRREAEALGGRAGGRLSSADGRRPDDLLRRPAAAADAGRDPRDAARRSCSCRR